MWSREAVAKIGCRWRCSWERARRARWQRALEHCACMVLTYSSSNLHGGNMHLCNVQSGNVQQSACTACNVQVGCMRHLHCTALDSCNDCSAIFLHSGHVTTCIDRSRQKRRHCTRCAAAYLRPRSQMCNLLQSSTEAIIFGQKLTCWGCWEREITRVWNSGRASNQIQWKQRHTRTFCKGGAFRSKLNSRHMGQNLIRCGNLGGA